MKKIDGGLISMVASMILLVVIILSIIVISERQGDWVVVSDRLQYMEKDDTVIFKMKESPSQKTFDDLLQIECVQGVKLDLEDGVKITIVVSSMYTHEALFDVILETLMNGIDGDGDDTFIQLKQKSLFP